MKKVRSTIKNISHLKKARSATKINSHIKKVRTYEKSAKHNQELIERNQSLFTDEKSTHRQKECEAQ